MHNVANKLKKTLLLTTCLLSSGALTQTNDHNSGGGVGGNYTCFNGCNPSRQSDSLTQAFIRSVVNQDVGTWKVGDKVNIYNPDGVGGIYGRAHAFSSTFFFYGETDDSTGPNPGSGSGNGNGGSGSGSGSGSGGTVIIIGEGGGNPTPCPGGVTVSPDGSVVTCHTT